MRNLFTISGTRRLSLSPFWGILVYVVCAILLPNSALSQTIDTLWSEDWEDNWIIDWHVDAGTWEVGVPTSGPDSAFIGLNCAATILDGNYTEPVDSRLIRHTSFVVPPASQNPRFRFWHWYSFSHSDYGNVQIKTKNSDWVTISGTYQSTSCGIWTHCFVDLSSYADSTVQIAFYFHSRKYYSGGDVSSGWYIDDITLETGPRSFDFPEGWESGIGHWYADFSIWQVGTPKSGPNSAFSANYCAATILDGNYCDNRDSKLISPEFIVPSASENPRIRFWHWYSFSHSDYGNVQIKTKNSDWVTISDTYQTTSCGIWWQCFVDLSSYADSSIQIAFNFHSHKYYSGGDISSGWYIDDLTLDTGPMILYNPEDWESGIHDWYTDFGIWQIGSPNSGPHSAFNGNHCACTIMDGNYCDNRDSRLISPWFIMPGDSENPALRFWHWYSFSHSDNGRVQIRTKNNEWKTISNIYTNTSGSIWSYPYIDLSLYADSIVQIAFYFHSIKYYSGGDVSSGWYIDDISIVGYVYPIILVEPDSLNFGNVLIDSTKTDSVIIKNIGTDTLHINSISITGIYSANFNVDTSLFFLVPGDSQFLSVSFTPDIVGVFNATLNIDSDGGNTYADLTGNGISSTGIKNKDSITPTEFSLSQNYPNPFNPVTHIRFGLPKASNVKIEIYNLLGQRVAVLLNKRKPAGYHTVEFDGRNFSSGVYLYRIQADEFQQVKKMLLVK
jgi:hypothetical protein